MGAPVGTVSPAMRGYMKEKTPKGWMFQHRAVMERAIGRPLRSDEQVHHINGDRADNRLENLQLRVGNHGSGQVLKCTACGGTDLVPVPLD